MKTQNLLVTIIIFSAFAGLAFADDVDDVRATIEQHYYLLQTGEVEAHRIHHLDDFTLFFADGSVLWESDYHVVAERMGATLDFPRLNMVMTDFKAQIYDDVAVVTFYLVGTYGEGNETRSVTNRVSAVWIKTEGEWKEAHHHESPLKPLGLG